MSTIWCPEVDLFHFGKVRASPMIQKTDNRITVCVVLFNRKSMIESNSIVRII